jgi:hypothetical protein
MTINRTHRRIRINQEDRKEDRNLGKHPSNLGNPVAILSTTHKPPNLPGRAEKKFPCCVDEEENVPYR